MGNIDDIENPLFALPGFADRRNSGIPGTSQVRMITGTELIGLTSTEWWMVKIQISSASTTVQLGPSALSSKGGHSEYNIKTGGGEEYNLYNTWKSVYQIEEMITCFIHNIKVTKL